MNATHHCHRYELAVDARDIDPPFMREDTLLDLYVCCQCSMYCVVSDLIPGVIPRQLVDEYSHVRLTRPPTEKTSTASVLIGWETLISIIEKRLWQDEQRILPVARVQFQQKVGWSQTAKQIFETLRFPMSIVPGTEEPGVCPPVIDPSISEGKQNRARLLRAWVEMSAWLTIYALSSIGPGSS